MSLPPEIKSHIWSYLDGPSLWQLRILDQASYALTWRFLVQRRIKVTCLCVARKLLKKGCQKVHLCALAQKGRTYPPVRHLTLVSKEFQDLYGAEKINVPRLTLRALYVNKVGGPYEKLVFDSCSRITDVIYGAQGSSTIEVRNVRNQRVIFRDFARLQFYSDESSTNFWLFNECQEVHIHSLSISSGLTFRGVQRLECSGLGPAMGGDSSCEELYCANILALPGKKIEVKKLVCAFIRKATWEALCSDALESIRTNSESIRDCSQVFPRVFILRLCGPPVEESLISLCFPQAQVFYEK